MRTFCQIAEIVKRNKGYAHSTAAARCLAIKYPFLEAEVVFAVEQVCQLLFKEEVVAEGWSGVESVVIWNRVELSRIALGGVEWWSRAWWDGN